MIENSNSLSEKEIHDEFVQLIHTGEKMFLIVTKKCNLTMYELSVTDICRGLLHFVFTPLTSSSILEPDFDLQLEICS